MRLNLYLILLLILINKYALVAQIPTDNPYRTKYNIDTHWTEGLKWKNVIDASRVKNLIDKKGSVDSIALHTSMKKISNEGGGVLYFPPGKYFFDFSIEMFDGVILRGANPGSNQEAINKNYKLDTKFVFPRYVPSYEGYGTPNTSFKHISAGNVLGKSNFGLVNIDVNRADISFWMAEKEKYHNNVIVFGVRSNNSAVPDEGTPWLLKNQMWQRFPFIYKESIVISSVNNALIANCIINDSITDNFLMPNFTTNDGYVFSKDSIKFDFGFHRGITLYGGEDNPENSQLILDNYVATTIDLKDMRLNANGKYVQKRNNREVDLPSTNLTDLIETNGFYSKATIDTAKRLFERKLYIDSSNDTLAYFLLKPSNYDKNKKYPLMLFFHGIGERGVTKNPLLHFVHLFVRKNILNEFPCFVIVPHILNDEGRWANNNLNTEPTKHLEMSINLVNDFIEKYSIDTARTWVSGLSFGGQGVFETLLRYPNLFSNAIVMSSFYNLRDDAIKKMEKVSIHISAGIFDTQIPIVYNRVTASKLRKANIALSYYEYDLPHFTWQALSMDKNFLNALLR